MNLFNQSNKSVSFIATTFDFLIQSLNEFTVLSNLLLVEHIAINSKNGSSNNLSC